MRQNTIKSRFEDLEADYYYRLVSDMKIRAGRQAIKGLEGPDGIITIPAQTRIHIAERLGVKDRTFTSNEAIVDVSEFFYPTAMVNLSEGIRIIFEKLSERKLYTLAAKLRIDVNADTIPSDEWPAVESYEQSAIEIMPGSKITILSSTESRRKIKIEGKSRITVCKKNYPPNPLEVIKFRSSTMGVIEGGKK